MCVRGKGGGGGGGGGGRGISAVSYISFSFLYLQPCALMFCPNLMSTLSQIHFTSSIFLKPVTIFAMVNALNERQNISNDELVKNRCFAAREINTLTCLYFMKKILS